MSLVSIRKKVESLFPNKQRMLWLGAGVGFIFFLAYQVFVTQISGNNYRLFDTVKNFSWVESPIGVFRKTVLGDIDNLILTRDEWKKFVLTFNLINPRQPAVVFHYRDADNYYFVYFVSDNQALILARSTNGVTRVLQGITGVRYGEEQNCRLEVTEKSAQVSIDGRVLGKIDFPATSGSLGFLVREADHPPTVFQGVRVQGRLKNGRSIVAHSPPLRLSSPVVEYLALIFFYLAILAVAVYLAYLFRVFSRKVMPDILWEKGRGLQLNSGSAALIHLFLTVCIFWPLVSQGKVLVSSYDNFGEIYPLFFFSKHQFQHWISGQGFPLWNPFFHNGTPFYSSHWNMLYYPFNWPIFLLSDRWVIFGLTIKTFLEVFFIGFLAYRFFVFEIGRKAWALIAAISYQLCSFVIFAFNLFPTTALYFAMTLYLYLLWSMGRRKALGNYLSLTFAVFLILTSANVAFVFYAVLALGVITVYRLSALGKERKNVFGLVALSGVTGFLLSAIRVVPSLLAISESNRIVENFYTLHDRVFLLIRFFLPEITGWLGPKSFNLLTSDNLHLVFKEFQNLPSNPQNAFFAYFGILPAVLLLAGLFLRGEEKFRFWRIYTLISLAITLLCQPFWGILNILTFPFSHFSYQMIILPVGVAAMIALVGSQLTQEHLSLTKFRRPFFVGIFLVQSYILVFLTYAFPGMTAVSRTILFLVFAGWCIYFILHSYDRGRNKAFLALLLLLANCLAAAVFFFTIVLVTTQPLAEKEGYWEKFLFPYLALLAAVGIALWFYAGYRDKEKAVAVRTAGIIGLFLVPGITIILLRTPALNFVLHLEDMKRVYLVDMVLGQLKFFWTFQLIIGAFVFFRIKVLPYRGLMVALTFLLALDLLAFQGRFDNITAPTGHRDHFYDYDYVYPNLSGAAQKQMDLCNYRVSSLYKGGYNGNKSITYSWPAYVGTLGYFPKRFSRFVSQFGFPKDSIMIYPEDEPLLSERFRDLCAVGYLFREFNVPADRPSALARMNLFYDYEIFPGEEEGLARLSQDSFDPLKTVVLNPGAAVSFTPQRGRPAQRLSIASTTGDVLKVQVNPDSPAMVLFVESYDKGWKAFVDGVAVPIRIANYNFMAFEVGPGEHQICLSYEPKNFYLGLNLSLAGLIVFMLGILGLSFLKPFSGEVRS